METALSIALGIALSAAAGFRIFVPLLALSIAGYTDVIHLTPGFAWIATIPAMIAFGTATIAEIVAYYVPWVDNVLDTIAAPAAVVAGTVISASVITDLPPLVRWSLVLIGGGGIAGIFQGATAFLRLKSTTFTAGLGNPVLATMELGGSVITVILGILVPAIAAGFLALLAIGVFLVARRVLFGRPARHQHGG